MLDIRYVLLSHELLNPHTSILYLYPGVRWESGGSFSPLKVLSKCGAVRRHVRSWVRLDEPGNEVGKIDAQDVWISPVVVSLHDVCVGVIHRAAGKVPRARRTGVL